jgi:hypothetical protein
MVLEVEQCLPYLDGCDMPREQRVNCINALQKFAQTVVNAAWDFDPSNPIDATFENLLKS